MGQCSSVSYTKNTITPEVFVIDPEQSANHKTIEAQLAEDKKQQENTVKMLLLGAGECGKSTILKQLKILHTNGYDYQQMMQLRPLIWTGILEGMQILCQAAADLGIEYTKPDSEKHHLVVASANNYWEQRKNSQSGEVEELETEDAVESSEKYLKKIKDAIRALWSDEAILMCFERRAEFQLNDSCKYFFDDINRIYANDYLPSEQDILMLRVATTGINESRMEIAGKLFRVFDVGGQRSERRKWIHCFDDVNAIIFLLAINEFDQVMNEDGQTNRLKEAMVVFANVSNSLYFKNTSLIMFLNKTDLFREKLAKGRSIRSAFTRYTGNDTYEESVAYIKKVLNATNKSGKFERELHMHETCATDTDQISKILSSVTVTIIESMTKSI